MAIKNYSELIAWQKAMDLVDAIYDASFPQKEMFGLANQLRRAAVPIPSNIAEGQGRSTTKDFVHFLCIARGSLQEVETQIIISHRRKYIVDEVKTRILQMTTEVGRILHGYMNALGK